ncbi:MAG: HD domain-containing protein [Oscillospiraceae bacterium]|nr:HD domain-containing protein [Oscillospiraceae bacterium]
MVTYDQIKNDKDIKTYIMMADQTLSALGFTEHSLPHVTRAADVAGRILTKLGYDKRTVELAKIAGYMHDIGNTVNRVDHAQSGAIMTFRILTNMDMPAAEISRIVSAIGNHDEGTAFPVNELAAALILADKSDVRRSRVRNKDKNTFDIHDRVNYAVEKSKLTLSTKTKKFILHLTIDESISHISEYFEIFLNRMLLCRKAADYFGYTFEVNINHLRVM